MTVHYRTTTYCTVCIQPNSTDGAIVHFVISRNFDSCGRHNYPENVKSCFVFFISQNHSTNLPLLCLTPSSLAGVQTETSPALEQGVLVVGSVLRDMMFDFGKSSLSYPKFEGFRDCFNALIQDLQTCIFIRYLLTATSAR